MSDGLTALLHLSEHDVSWLAQLFSLWVLPLAHEDLAIILGAYIVVNNIMPAGLVVLCIYGGMVASDFALYGIGAGARHVPWLTRLAVDDRVRGFGDTLKRNLFGIVALCRVVPGVVFIAFVACGWTRVPLARFAVATLITSALYLPLMLCIVIFFGNALDDRVGWWTWPFLLCVLFAIGFVRRQVFSFQETSNRTSNPDDAKRSPMAARNRGTRAARRLPPQGAWAERIPRGLFYLPLILSWIGFALRYRSLTLPTVANPRHPTGRAWGGSRSSYLLDVAGQERRWIAEAVVIARSAGPRTLSADLECARQSLRSAGLAFPLMAKPDVGRHGASRIDDVAALREYLRNFPGGAKLILQAFVPHEQQSRGALCAAAGRAERTHPLVDLPAWTASAATRAGISRRSSRRGSTPWRAACASSTTAASSCAVASADDLMRGENFSIVAINGIGSAADRRLGSGFAGRRSLSPLGRQSAHHVPDRRDEPRARLRAAGVAPTSSNFCSGRTRSVRRYPASA